MEIDIKPIIEEASHLDKIALHYREEDAFYLFRTFEGKDYSVKFTKQSLDEFQPNKTVSEMIQSWEANIDRRIKQIKKALKTGKHPYNKKWVESETEWTIRYGKRVRKMVESDEYEDLNAVDIKSFNTSLNNLTKESGKISFIKLV